MKKNRLYHFLFLACLSGTLSFAGCDLFEDSELEPATTNNGGSGNNNNSNNNSGNNNNGGSGNNNGGSGSDNHDGWVMFWCRSKEDAGGFVEFRNMLPRQFLYYFPDDVPDCGDKGTHTFYAPPGDYPYELYWIKDGQRAELEQEGIVTITSKGCTKVLVKRK